MKKPDFSLYELIFKFARIHYEIIKRMFIVVGAYPGM